MKVLAVIIQAKKAIKRDGTVGGIRQVAFCEPNEVNKQRAVRELLEWAYNYAKTADSAETGIARILTPEALVLYEKIRETGGNELDWARLFTRLEKDKVTFSTEVREIE